VDVEEHFQVSAFDQVLTRADWDAQPSRVEANTDRLLELLARHGARGTFFTLGWVAERRPALVRRIAAMGHELASHGWWHWKVTTLTPAAFRDEVRRSRQLLEDLSGTRVEGFRAPSFSIRPGLEWSFDILLEEGYRWDSSLFPIHRPDYGYPQAPRQPHRLVRERGTLLEFPMLTRSIGSLRIPAAGGGYLRHFPPGIMRSALRQAERQGQPGMVYIHPWEVDPEQPRLPVGWLTTRRHYGGLGRTLPRLEQLLAEFRFTSVRDWLAEHPL
jgi:polysaccharide deacetylase family protein (PEP-CTERM system associated)